MKTIVVVGSLLCLLGVARAQPSTVAPSDATALPIDFLEMCVTDELAADGILLSRLGVELEIEPVGDKMLISLVDAATGRASASTKLDDVALDREVLVANLTQVAANLVAQLQLPAVMTPLPAPAAAAPIDDGGLRERAEQQYLRDAVGFGNELVVFGEPTVFNTTRRWRAHQGETQIPLEGEDFYHAIERPDLAASYRARRRFKLGAGITALVGLVATGVLASRSYAGCEKRYCLGENDERDAGYALAANTTSALSLIAAGVFFYYHWRPHPISETDARRYAAEYNRRLRIRLELPVATVTGDSAGIALAGRF